MKWIIGIAAVFAVGLARPVGAVPRINTISSETISTSPLRIKTTFTVQLVGYEPFGYQGLEVFSGSGPAVHFFACEAPASWSADVWTYGSTSYASFVTPDYYPWPWPGVTTFSITTDQPNPCVSLDFWNPLLSKTPHTNYDYVVDGCLVVDAPTPAGTTSWGAVKAIYR